GSFHYNSIQFFPLWAISNPMRTITDKTSSKSFLFTLHRFLTFAFAAVRLLLPSFQLLLFPLLLEVAGLSLRSFNELIVHQAISSSSNGHKQVFHSLASQLNLSPRLQSGQEIE